MKSDGLEHSPLKICSAHSPMKTRFIIIPVLFVFGWLSLGGMAHFASSRQVKGRYRNHEILSRDGDKRG